MGIWVSGYHPLLPDSLNYDIIESQGQIKSNQIKSNQIKSNQFKSIQFNSIQFKYICSNEGSDSVPIKEAVTYQ
jgi:hypothetical protein